MVWHVVEHGAYNAEFVGVLGDTGEEFANLNTALPVRLKFKLGAERRAAQALVLAKIFSRGKRFSVEFYEFRLRIKGVHL